MAKVNCLVEIAGNSYRLLRDNYQGYNVLEDLTINLTVPNLSKSVYT